MEYEDLAFTVTDKNGKEVECNIVSLIPKNDTESYVVFFDDTKDENGNIVFKYGRLVKDNDEYELKTGINENELEYIQNWFHYDMVNLASSIIEKNEG